MKTIATLAVALMILSTVCWAEGDKTPLLTVKTLKASMSWKQKGDYYPGDYGNFTLVFSVSTTLADLTTISNTMTSFLQFLNTTTQVNLAEWTLKKSTTAKRMYKDKDITPDDKPYSHTTVFSLDTKKQELTCTMRYARWEDLMQCLGLQNVTTSMVQNVRLHLRLPDKATGVFVVQGGCMLPCDIVSVKDKKVTVAIHTP